MTELPSNQLAALSKLPTDKATILFTRHSIRECAAHGFASYSLPLTESGVELANYWGRQLARPVSGLYSSPVARCVDTAKHLSLGLSEFCTATSVVEESLLVEPGCYVQDITKVGQLFLDLGPLAFVCELLQDSLPGVLSAHQGTVNLLRYFRSRLCEDQSLAIHVSHDTILASFVYSLLGKTSLNEGDWPKMMEGVFLWFDWNAGGAECIHWIWRGSHGQRVIADFSR